MDGKAHEIKGRIKEAAGTLTGDEKLRQEGKIEKAVGKAEEAVEKIADKVKNAIEKAVE